MIYRCKVANLKKWDEPEQIKNILDDLEKHKDKEANSYCAKCEKFMCKKCEQFHSEFFV